MVERSQISSLVLRDEYLRISSLKVENSIDVQGDLLLVHRNAGILRQADSLEDYYSLLYSLSSPF